jgi:hypothetical protein
MDFGLLQQAEEEEIQVHCSRTLHQQFHENNIFVVAIVTWRQARDAQ